MADIVQGHTHFLQRRNHDPSKAAANLVGFFGGQLEQGESYRQAVSRELQEETSLTAHVTDFTYVGKFIVDMEHNDEKLIISGKCYKLELASDYSVEAREGELVKISSENLIARLHEMSPATADVVNKYYR